MKVKEIFFRELYRQICLLTNTNLVEKINLQKVFDFPPDEKLDGFLTYAYVDVETFVFEIIAGAKTSGNKIKIFPASYKKSVKLKRSEFEEVDLKIMTAEYSLPFRDRIEMINDNISNDDKDQTRLIKNLDDFRHPYYPDDVIVYFFSAEHKTELLWVRCLSIDENILTGELLNEPHENFGCHAGDKIMFGVAQIGAQNILIYLPATEDKALV